VPGAPDSVAGDDPAHRELRAGVIVGITVYVLWGLLTLYWKLLREFDPFELIGWRIVSSSALMIVALSVTRGWRRLAPVVRDRALLARVAGAAVLLTVNWTSYVYAVVDGHVLETALGYFIAPLGTILIGVVVFHEHLDRAQRVAVALAVIALVVLTVSYGKVPWLALTIAVSWSVYGWMKKQVPLTPIESMSAESLLLLVPAIVVLVVMWDRADSIANTAAPGQVTLVAVTGLATVLPLTMFAWAAQRVPLTLLGPMQYSVPSINFLLGWLLYDEAMPLERLAGFVLVWIGLALVTADAVRRSRSRWAPQDEPAIPVGA
jgi:chloramphenicol-sensitive protein RarD